MNTKEKLETIETAAQEALEKLIEARDILQAATDETGYCFGYQIKQELSEEYIGCLAHRLAEIAGGEKRSDIKADLRHEE
jgi:site-specific recombinase XerD